MVFSEIKYGLGNQMLQYAFGRKIAHERNEPLYIVKRWYRNREWESANSSKRVFQLNNFKIKADIASVEQEQKFWINRSSVEASLKKYLAKKVTRNPIGNVCIGRRMYSTPQKNIKTITNMKGDVYLTGLWKHRNYFSDIVEILRKEFEPADPLGGKCKKIISKMRKENSFSVHIRRGDYLRTGHSVLSNTKYYQNAFEAIQSIRKDASVYVFSDDMKWCKANIKPDLPTTFVDINSTSEPYKDIILMKNCKHNVVANSTFSLWGALLNDNKRKKVFGPKGWAEQIGNNYIKGMISLNIK